MIQLHTPFAVKTEIKTEDK
uniref:Uncharacterized protein n=1 Tax=Anguilla anguilla TaxID=7936 RepID=A0A0E9VKQ8_ANGAN